MMETKSSLLKLAKKTLKRHELDSMKLKTLAKQVVEAWHKKAEENVAADDNDNKLQAKLVQQWISESSTFAVEGKLVRLSSKKRKQSKDGKAEEGGEENDSKKLKSSESSPSLADTSSSPLMTVAQTWRQEHRIVIKSSTDDEQGREETARLNRHAVYFPWTSFDDCKAMEQVLIRYCTDDKKFQKPSPIQSQCWPLMCCNMLNTNSNGSKNETNQRHDVVGIAETGSGKTLAFALPILSSMYRSDKSSKRQSFNRSKPRLLVLCPTRELAMQTQAVLDEFCPLVQLQSVVIYGGVPKSTQKAALRQQVDAIVATPGRLKDLIQDGSCDLSQVQYIVLDEADRMLECGFEEEVRSILSNCPEKSERQTCMFSATWPAVIQKIAMEYMVQPVRVYVGFAPITQTGNSSSSNENGVDHHDMIMDDSLSANKRVKQIVEVVEDRQREDRLRQLLRQHQSNSGKTNKNKDGDKQDRILVFCLYKKEAERLEITLKRGGYNCSSIHGNKNQAARTQALSQFKDGSVPLLVATDVAARGLDIPDVQLVINFTFPLTIEDYVHRIGRTGRQGKTGIAHTFFQPTDKGHAGELQAVLRQAGQEIPEALAKFGSTIKRKEHKLYGNFGPKGAAAGEPMKKATKITFNYSDDEN